MAKKEQKLIKIEYGAMSSKYSIKCKNKLEGYAAILMHYRNSPGMVCIYSPEELKPDSWLNFSGDTEKRVEDLFKTDGGFASFIGKNKKSVLKAYSTIKQLI